MRYNSSHEWLEPDGLGGFASGTATGLRTRRYHALLLTATTPPSGRMVLMNGFDAWIETPAGRFNLSSQLYTPNVRGGDGADRISDFTIEPWPTWKYSFADGTELQQEIVAAHGSPAVVVSWKLIHGAPDTKLFVRPFMSGRDYHGLHRENGAFQFAPRERGDQLVWQTYPGVPEIVSYANAAYYHDPQWYRNFLYTEEQARGLDCVEDLASPGILMFEVGSEEALWLLSTEETSAQFEHHCSPSSARAHNIRANERLRRQRFESPLLKAADAYIVSGTRGKTILAGYPWFTDWGRDTFIALRGLCLAPGRLDDAQEILTAWAGVVSEGMLPNRFPDRGAEPEFNSADASLWFIIAAHEFLELSAAHRVHLNGARTKLEAAIEAILSGYHRGTRFGIRADADGLLAAGIHGMQLTWMDAKIGDWVVTARVGKPVELQALWLNALWIGSRLDRKWKDAFELGLATFRARFWNPDREALFDVVDVNHIAGAVDATFRPNQILAVGGLPLNLLDREKAAKVVAAVEKDLLTPLGLRSLAPDEPGYTRCYEGGVAQRDGCYHQGTVWPWLLGPFVEAWVRVRGGTDQARAQARDRFVDPVMLHLHEAGLGHISEIADAESPHRPRGCPFQAWSVGEMLRINRFVLAQEHGRGRKSDELPKPKGRSRSRRAPVPRTNSPQPEGALP
jgi:predicted glycogen debranching enzyme